MGQKLVTYAGASKIMGSFSHKLIAMDDEVGWNVAINSIPHVHTHSHWYNKAMQVATNKKIFLYVGENAGFRVACPLALRKRNEDDPYDVLTPYGFSGFACSDAEPRFNDSWYQFAREQNLVCGYLALHPLLQKNYSVPDNELSLGKKTYFLNTRDQSLSEIFKHFSKSHHYVLKQWWREKFEIRISKDPQYRHAFYDLYEPTLKRKQASSVYYFGRDAMDILFDSEHTYLISVIVDNTIVASAIFILYREQGDFFLIATLPEAQIHTRGLIWEGIKLCHEKNIHYLHLGGGVKENDSLELFKARFGGEAHQTCALKQIYHHDLYQHLCAKYQVNPKDAGSYFPQYWSA